MTRNFITPDIWSKSLFALEAVEWDSHQIREEYGIFSFRLHTGTFFMSLRLMITLPRADSADILLARPLSLMQDIHVHPLDTCSIKKDLDSGPRPHTDNNIGIIYL